MSNVCQIFCQNTIDTLDMLVYTLDILITKIGHINMEAIMIMTRTEKKASIDQLQKQPASYPVPSPSICSRCGGLMVNEVCLDLMNSTSELECATRRCVQCGDIVDPVILRNRRCHQESMSTQSTQKLGQPIELRLAS